MSIERKNRHKAWCHFVALGLIPVDANKSDWILHHKDPTLKFRDRVRYEEWRFEDLRPMTRAEHARIHDQDSVWINNGVSEGKIHKDVPIPPGWVTGRLWSPDKRHLEKMRKGSSHPRSEETKLRMRKPKSEEHRRNISKAKRSPLWDKAEEIAEKYRETGSTVKVAKMFGVSQALIYNILRKNEETEG